MSNEEYPFMYQVVCAWCNRHMRFQYTKSRGMHGMVSHGICPDCFEDQKKVVMEYKEKLEQDVVLSEEDEADLYQATIEMESHGYETEKTETGD